MTIIAIAMTVLLANNQPVFGQTVSSSLIPLPSETGEKLLRRSKTSDYSLRIILQYLTEQTPTYCSIASATMVLNALRIPAPIDDEHPPYRMFTQDNFFTPEVTKILPADLVKKQGSTLQQIEEAIGTFPVSTRAVHANKMTLGDFRRTAAHLIRQGNGYIIVNYLRTSVGQEGAGHMSPLAAYDQASDRFLILDVARYRYPPVWVRTQDLWKAMHTTDDVSNEFRGFVIVSK